jgi:hypothetical protein
MSNYRFYYPDLLEKWDAEQYQDVVKYFADNPRYGIVTFCADLYYHNGGDTAKNAAKNLTQFAAECAKFENCTIDPQEAKDWINNLQKEWFEAVKAKDEEIKRITLILNECPLYKLVTFVSNILFRGEIAEGLFYLGYLAGSLSKGTL